jgi:hypothetical protein
LLGYIEKLRYSYQDVTNTDKFPEFSKRVYLHNVGIGPFGEPIHQPVQWVAGLAKTGILGLLDLPHFGRGQYANNCVKKLMAVTHDKDIWLEQLVSIDVQIITHITGMPSWGMDPTQLLEDKKKEKSLAEEMNKKYDTERGSSGIIIKCISDITTRMATKNHGMQASQEIPTRRKSRPGSSQLQHSVPRAPHLAGPLSY